MFAVSTLVGTPVVAAPVRPTRKVTSTRTVAIFKKKEAPKKKVSGGRRRKKILLASQLAPRIEPCCGRRGTGLVWFAAGGDWARHIFCICRFTPILIWRSSGGRLGKIDCGSVDARETSVRSRSPPHDKGTSSSTTNNRIPCVGNFADCQTTTQTKISPSRVNCGARGLGVGVEDQDARPQRTRQQ